MIIAAVQYGNSSEHSLPAYTYTGTAPTLATDANGNWELAFTANCVVNFSKIGTVDVFVVAGGMPGGGGQNTVVAAGYATVKAGNGGKGGGCATATGVQLTRGRDYTVSVGGSGQSSSAFGVTAESGAGSAAGSGAYGTVSNYGTESSTASTAGTDGVYAFSASTSLINSGRKYGAGGGGGAATVASTRKDYSAGGATGGGAGGQDLNQGDRPGVAGTTNTGGGGGGGEATYTGTANHTGTGGAGGSGIVIIRNHREET